MTLDELTQAMIDREVEHSSVFWEGAKAALAWRLSGTHIHCSYFMGSMEFDAFYFGIHSGHEFWLSYRPVVV